MKIQISETVEEIELVRDGKVIARWFKANGSWDSFTKKVKEDGHWGRFLVFEEQKPKKPWDDVKEFNKKIGHSRGKGQMSDCKDCVYLKECKNAKKRKYYACSDYKTKSKQGENK